MWIFKTPKPQAFYKISGASDAKHMVHLLTPDAYRHIVQIINQVLHTFTLKVTQCYARWWF